jgi:hypothetical protein
MKSPHNATALSKMYNNHLLEKKKYFEFFTCLSALQNTVGIKQKRRSFIVLTRLPGVFLLIKSTIIISIVNKPNGLFAISH